MLGILPCASQNILTGTFSKKRSNDVVGIGSDAAAEVVFCLKTGWVLPKDEPGPRIQVQVIYKGSALRRNLQGNGRAG